VATDFTITTPTAADWDDLYQLLTGAFLQDVDPEASVAERHTYEPDRTLVARRDGDMLGTGAAFTRDLAVPGAVVPVAHVTQVGVAATARRQGVLTAIMRRQLADLHAGGTEPIAALWASEGRIYQRFGYGLAARKASLQVDTRELRFNPGVAFAAGRLRAMSPQAALPQLQRVYAESMPTRPGWSQRHERTWAYLLADPPSRRRGRNSFGCVLHETPEGVVDGYVMFRPSNKWNDQGPDGEVAVQELVADDPATYATLWRYVLTMDLTRTATAWSVAEDEPLIWMVNEPGRLGFNLGDALWVRIVDVPGALTARRYAAAVDVTIEVSDELLEKNSGRWRLRASTDGATCESTMDEAELACDVSALAAAYLGGASLATLAAAGRVRELRPGALAAASAAFSWHRAPHAIEVF
jgi:predicted acetyltransferase